MSNQIHVATRKGLFTLVRNGSGKWEMNEPAFLGVPVTMSLADPRDGTWYAALDHGHFGTHLHRSRDRGKTWQEVAVPKFPANATVPERMLEEPADGPPDQPPTKPAALSEIWALQPCDDNQPGTLWCGTIPAALFRSDDGGESWQLNQSLWDQPERYQWFGGGKDDSGLHSICVDPRDSGRIRVAISCGGVWETTDAGKSWQNTGQGLRADFLPPDQQYTLIQQDPHLMVACPADPDGMWIQHHNGIFRSTDAGHNWEEIKEAGLSVFGFAVAVHPRDAGTAWFVPGVKDECRVPVEGKLVVTKTTDGGQTFQAQQNGLPQQHAYDIVFRHALAIDDSGERLAMGSSTGNFWITENGGEQWENVSTNLPPIYSVRFVAEK